MSYPAPCEAQSAQHQVAGGFGGLNRHCMSRIDILSRIYGLKEPTGFILSRPHTKSSYHGTSQYHAQIDPLVYQAKLRALSHAMGSSHFKHECLA